MGSIEIEKDTIVPAKRHIKTEPISTEDHTMVLEPTTTPYCYTTEVLQRYRPTHSKKSNDPFSGAAPYIEQL